MLCDVEMFDASFFGYSPKDAALMDPQQRLFLEVCWEAFENAGYDPTGYPGRVGVLSTGGGIVSSYLLAKLHHADLPGQTASTSHINNDKDFLSTRVSFKLNLRGPSFTIQSACSSSLVAVHLACQTLRVNECNMMLARGLVVRVPQVRGYLADKRSLHSLDGHCPPSILLAMGRFLVAASEPYCSSPWNKRCQIAIIFLRLSKEPRRITMVQPRVATPPQPGPVLRAEALRRQPFWRPVVGQVPRRIGGGAF
jgi:hypothetical protein